MASESCDPADYQCLVESSTSFLRTAASRVMNYLSQHPDVCIIYSGSRLDLHMYTDPDWGSDKDTRRSTTGALIKMAGGPVNWIS